MNDQARDIIARHEKLTGPIQKEAKKYEWDDWGWKMRDALDARQEIAARRWLLAL